MQLIAEMIARALGHEHANVLVKVIFLTSKPFLQFNLKLKMYVRLNASIPGRTKKN